jgi:hypothetical protein
MELKLGVPNLSLHRLPNVVQTLLLLSLIVVDPSLCKSLVECLEIGGLIYECIKPVYNGSDVKGIDKAACMRLAVKLLISWTGQLCPSDPLPTRLGHG